MGPTPTLGMRLSCNFVNVYTIVYPVQYTYTFTKLHDIRIPNVGVGVRVGPVGFQLKPRCEAFFLTLPRSDETRCLPCRSLGCTVVLMLTSKPPWHELEEEMAIVFQIGKSDKPKYQLPTDRVSELARNFVERCFVHDPLQRPSAAELLRDPFLCDRVELHDYDERSSYV